MSSACDVLLFAAPGDPGIEQLLEKIRIQDRFEAAPYPVDTGEFSGPNVYGAAVLAYGADYWPYFDDDHQELLDSVRWRSPGSVVLIVQREFDDVAQVYRPAFEVERGGYYNSEARAVQVASSGLSEVPQ